MSGVIGSFERKVEIGVVATNGSGAKDGDVRVGVEEVSKRDDDEHSFAGRMLLRLTVVGAAVADLVRDILALEFGYDRAPNRVSPNVDRRPAHIEYTVDRQNHSNALER